MGTGLLGERDGPFSTVDEAMANTAADMLQEVTIPAHYNSSSKTKTTIRREEGAYCKYKGSHPHSGPMN